MNPVARLRRAGISTTTVLWAALFLNGYLLLLGAYQLYSGNRITGLTPIVVPLVWLGLGTWVMTTLDVPEATARKRRIGAALAVGYFGVLAVVSGMVGPGVPAAPTGWRLVVTALPPGWAPALLVTTDVAVVRLLPYQVVGYAALAYLVYATVLDAAGSVVSGVLGLLSCVSCTWPVLATLLTGVLGGGSALTAAVYDQSYLLSTAIFAVTVGLLYWRPGWR